MKRIRLTENDLHRIVKETVKRVLRENNYTDAANAYKSHVDGYDKIMRNGGTIGDEDRAKESALYDKMCSHAGERFDPNMPVIVVGGSGEGEYTAGELGKYFELGDTNMPSRNPIYNDGKTIGYPSIKGYIGPMWDGDKIRYESQEAYDFYSR